MLVIWNRVIWRPPHTALGQDRPHSDHFAAAHIASTILKQRFVWKVELFIQSQKKSKLHQNWDIFQFNDKFAQFTLYSLEHRTFSLPLTIRLIRISILRIIQSGCYYWVLPAALPSLLPDCPATSSPFLPWQDVKRSFCCHNCYFHINHRHTSLVLEVPQQLLLLGCLSLKLWEKAPIQKSE